MHTIRAVLNLLMIDFDVNFTLTTLAGAGAALRKWVNVELAAGQHSKIQL